MFNVNVATSYQNGTIVHMDPNDAFNFIIGISITVINMINISKNSDDGPIHLLGHYTDGISEAIYSNILQTNADILLKFVQDAVLNNTSKGLYLFYNRRKNGEDPYNLVVKALEDVHQYYIEYGADYYKRDTTKYLNRYNDDFINLMNQ